jgi:hypothetical protein
MKLRSKYKNLSIKQISYSYLKYKNKNKSQDYFSKEIIFLGLFC